MQTAAVGTGAEEGADQTEGFEEGGDAGDRQGVVVGMEGAGAIDVEEAVPGKGAEANAVEVAALLDEAIAEGMAGFGLPVGGVTGVRMTGVNVVEAVGEKSEERIFRLLNGLKG
jgi:hypothetical protein